MRRYFFPILIAALLSMPACSHQADNTPVADDIQSSATTDSDPTADSLARYLGISLAETVRASIDQNADGSDFDPDLFAKGVRSMAFITPERTGFEFGALHGAAAQEQLIILRRADIAIDPLKFIAGFARGMKCDTINRHPQATLDQLMTKANNKIIRAKMRTHHNRQQVIQPTSPNR